MGLFSSYTDTLFGKDYGDKDKSNINAALGPYEKQIPGLYGGAQGFLLKALAASNAGFAGAQAGLARQGTVGTRNLMDVFKQNTAGMNQSLVSRGLYNTTALEAGQRGVMADSTRALAELNAALAQQQSQLAIGQGQAQAGIYGEMSSLNQNQAQLLASLGLGKAGLFSKIQYGKQGGILNDVLKIAAASAGAGG
jgi:hypothetical protein